jgi:serine protease AprX
LWQLGFRGEDVTVAIIDTGIAARRFPGQIAWAIDLADNADTDDHVGHGTSMAEAILQFAPSARIASVKVFARDGTAARDTVAAALTVCRDRRSELGVVLLSLGFRRRLLGWVSCTYERPCALCTTVNEVVDQGLIVVAAAGNLGPRPDTLTCPGHAEKAITVGAYEKIAAAPERGVQATAMTWLKRLLPSRYYSAEAGTSLAAARTAGGIAVLLSALPRLAREDILAATRETATLMAAEPHEAGARIPHWYRAYKYLCHRRASKAIDVSRAQALCDAGWKLCNVGKFEQACESFAAAAECVPTSWGAQSALGRAHLEAGDLTAAIDAFTEAIRLHWAAAEPHNGLGVALARRGHLASALHEYGIACELDPQWQVPKANHEGLQAEMRRRQEQFPGLLVFD